MGKAIGMVELTTVSAGVTCADTMIKTAEVDIIQSSTDCPGKYIVIISGELSAVKASVDAAKAIRPDKVIDSFVLGNPADAIFPAIYGATAPENPEALGVLESYSAASAIVAADTAAKTSLVDLVELRLAKGMCGKSYLFITGTVSAVQAAIEKAQSEVAEKGMLLDSSVIPRPDKKLWQSIL